MDKIVVLMLLSLFLSVSVMDESVRTAWNIDGETKATQLTTHLPYSTTIDRDRARMLSTLSLLFYEGIHI